MLVFEKGVANRGCNLLIAGKRISGSLIPLFFFVALAETQSLKGPAVARPINAPIKMAKLKNPIVCASRL